jgi:predicted transcriptional regulator
MEESDSGVIEMTADIVSAFVGENTVSMESLPDLIRSIHSALNGIATGASTAPAPAPEKPIPAVSIRKSVTPDFLICLEDGQSYKSLKRHLRTKYGMSPEDYRRKWGLPKDYPMVAPAYAASRSALAKAAGLGRGGVQKASPAKTKRGAKAAKPG